MTVNIFQVRLLREALFILFSPSRTIYTTEEIRREMEAIVERTVAFQEAENILNFLCVVGCLQMHPIIVSIRHERTFDTFSITTIVSV